jgi:hypothetical protein
MTVNGLQRAVEGVFSLAWVAIGHNCALDYEGGYHSDDRGIECGFWVDTVMRELEQNLLADDVVVYRLYGDHYRSRTTDFVRVRGFATTRVYQAGEAASRRRWA